MVPRGVANSWAAAAARPPKDFNSLSLDKVCSKLSRAFDLFLCSSVRE